jgi:hypothetical protein
MKPLILALLVASGVQAQSTVNAATTFKGSVTTTSNVVFASQIPNMVLDGCNPVTGLNSGGTVCADNAARMNAVLTTATVYKPVTLLLDIGSGISAAIAGTSSGNWAIVAGAPGAGLFALAGCNCTVINNGVAYPSAGTPPAQGANITIEGVYLNGNRSNQNACANVCFGIELFNVSNIHVRGVTITNVTCFATVFGNVSFVWVEENQILQANISNTDPIHFDGPFSNLTVRANQLQSGDDCIALNLPEGYGGNGSNVALIDNQMVGTGCSDYVRVYNNVGGGGYPTYTLTNAIVEGLTGLATCTANPSIFYFHEAVPYATEALNMKISHVDVSGSGNCQLMQAAGSWGEIDLSDWILKNPAPNLAAVVLEGVITTSTISDGVIERTVTANNTAWPVQVVSHPVMNLNLANLSVVDINGGSFSAAPQLLDVSNGGTVGSLSLNTPFNGNGKIANLFSSVSQANVGTLSGVLNFGYGNGQVPSNNVTTSAFNFGTITPSGSTIAVTGYQSATYANVNTTASQAVTGTLPVAAAGMEFCLSNSNSGSAAETGALTFQTSGSGQYIVNTDGTLSASGGYVTSSGAAADSACVVGQDSTHWLFKPTQGLWSKH